MPVWEAHRSEAPGYMEIGPKLGMRSRSAAQYARYALVGRWIREQARPAVEV